MDADVRLVAMAPDDPALLALHAERRADLAERYELFGPLPDDPVENDAFTPPDGVFFVALAGGEPVAFAGLHEIAPAVGEIKRMFVSQPYRRLGVGRALLAALEAEAVRAGHRTLRLETGVMQPEAVAMYEALGYRRIPCYGQWAENPPSICFERSLDGTGITEAS